MRIQASYLRAVVAKRHEQTRTARPLPAVLVVFALGCGQDVEARRVSERTSGRDSPVVVGDLLTVQHASITDSALRRIAVPRIAAGRVPTDTLQIVRVFGDSSTFGRVTGLRPAGKYLVVSDAQMDPRIAVLDFASGKLLFRLGRNGSGPFEFRDPRYILPDTAENSRVWVYDFNNKRLTLIDLEAREREWFISEKSLNVGVSLERPIMTEGRILANGLFEDFVLAMLDSVGTPVRRLGGDLPYSFQHVPHRTGLRLINRTFIAEDPARKRIAIGFQWKSRIDYFSSSGKRFASIRGPRETRASFRIADKKFFWGDDTQMAYVGLAAGRERVYALFMGAGSTKQKELPSLVHVFSWDGAFLGEFALPDQAYTIAISQDEQHLLASVLEPFPRILLLKLPTFSPTRVKK